MGGGAALTALWIVVSVLWAYSLALGVLVLGLIRRIGTVLDRAEMRLREPLHVRPPGLEPGMRIPAFEGYDETGARFDHTRLFGRQSLVVFLSPDCPPCRSLAPEIGVIEPEMADVFVVMADSQEGRAFAEQLSVPVVYQTNREISDAFGTNATPHVFAINERGVVVGAGSANDARGLMDIGSTLIGGGEISNGPLRAGAPSAGLR
jgi:thiol-disulfide isomerase/thioredoxin